MEHDKKDKLYSVVLLVLCIAFLCGIAFFYLSTERGYHQYGNYKFTMSYDYTTHGEHQAIIHAEGTNYSNLLNISRFNGQWANFIDNETIKHYNDSYHKAMELKEEVDISNNYSVSSRHYSSVNITIAKGSQYFSTRIFLNETNANGNGLKNYSRGYDISYRSNMFSYYNTTESVIVNGCYVIEMELYFSYSYAPLAAYFGETSQLVILDDNFNLITVLASPSPMGVS